MIIASETPRTKKEWIATLEFCNKQGQYPDQQHVELANLAEKLEEELIAIRNANQIIQHREGELIAKMLYDLDVMKEQRNELLAALEELMETDSDCDFNIDARCAARAAIAKVKGETA